VVRTRRGQRASRPGDGDRDAGAGRSQRLALPRNTERTLSTKTNLLRLRIDASKCDAQGVCKLVAPEFFELDRYGYAYVLRGAPLFTREDRDVYSLAEEAEATCPRAAIMIERRAPLPEAPTDAEPAPAPEASPPAVDDPRLLASDGLETLESWRAAGGFRRHEPGVLLGEVTLADLRGQGGSGFPVARKWAALTKDGVLVANGAEREPGTVKDAYLLTKRPYAVLDGALAAAHDRGLDRVVVAIPEGEPEIRSALEEARDTIASSDVSGATVDIVDVSRAYVGGEETALLASIQGDAPKPRLRPPFPAERGLNGRPTLVQNVETLTHVALVNAYGGAWFRERGSETQPGTGLFSVGAFGGRFELYERAFGDSLADLLADAGFGGDAAAVLVGGYSGGLLRRDQVQVGLDAVSLSSVGGRVGTKSVQVVPEGSCVLRILIEVLRFFGSETAVQCPPCHRGLPDMVSLLERVEAGDADQAVLDDFTTFMETFAGRGLCALPDGSAAIALSYLRNFADELELHMTSGCPVPA
jgi:NADH-quinone oxidoreductase subunit F